MPEFVVVREGKAREEWFVEADSPADALLYWDQGKCQFTELLDMVSVAVDPVGPSGN